MTTVKKREIYGLISNVLTLAIMATLLWWLEVRQQQHGFLENQNGYLLGQQQLYKRLLTVPAEDTARLSEIKQSIKILDEIIGTNQDQKVIRQFHWAPEIFLALAVLALWMVNDYKSELDERLKKETLTDA